MRYQGREDELLARLCSNHSPRSLSVAAVTGMYGGNGGGKSLDDCFFDLAAARTKDQKKAAPDVEKGRISLTWTHAVGSQAVEVAGVIGFGRLKQSVWDLNVDTPTGWDRERTGLRMLLLEAERDADRCAKLLDIDHEERAAVDRIEKRSERVLNVPVAVLMRRALGSYGGAEKMLRELCKRPDPLEAVGDWYAGKSDGKTRRVSYINALTKPWGEVRFTEWGDLATPAEALAVSTLRDIQQVLTALGHYKGPIDGDFGAKSQAALKAWVKAEGLKWEECWSEGLVLGLPRQLLSIDAEERDIETGTVAWKAGQVS